MDVIKYITASVKTWFFEEESLDYIDTNVTVWEAFFTTWVLFTLTIMSSYLISTFITLDKMYMSDYILYLNIAQVVFFPIIIFISYSILHLFLKLFGGTAVLSETIKFLCSSSIFIYIIFFIFQLLTILILNISYYLLFLIYILYLPIFIWYITVILKPLSVIHNISKLRVFFAIMTPVVILFIIMILFWIVIYSIFSGSFY